MANENIEKTLKDWLQQHYPGEELRGYLLGAERPNFWLEFLLLGPIATAIASRNYYMGLTIKRIVLIALSSWTNRPTDKSSEILLGRIAKMESKSWWLTGHLQIDYDEGGKRRFVFYRRYRENAKNFVESFDLLPKPMLTEEEKAAAVAAEAAYKGEASDRMTMAVAFLVIWVIIALICVFGANH
jgi:hypothetical protein